MLVFGDVSLKSIKKNYLSLFYVPTGSSLGVWANCDCLCLPSGEEMNDGNVGPTAWKLGHDEMMNDRQGDQRNPQETKRIRWLGATLTTTLKTYFIGHLYDGDWMYISK